MLHLKIVQCQEILIAHQEASMVCVFSKMVARPLNQKLQYLQSVLSSLNLIDVLNLLDAHKGFRSISCVLKKIKPDVHVLNFSLNLLSGGQNTL